MKKNLLFATLVVLVPSFAMAHVSVRPRESKPGAEEQYTVRVPTEGAAGASRPASVTKLSASGAGAQSNDAAAVEAWLKGYDAAFNAKDVDKLATFYHPDVTIYEGGGINNGWIDYRDRHLGPELKSFENLQFGHSNTKVTVLPGGQSAYATSEYSIKAKVGDRQLDSGGLETLVLVKSGDGTWKIRHSHTSSRARRPQA